jgi:hypothetical protein
LELFLRMISIVKVEGEQFSKWNIVPIFVNYVLDFMTIDNVWYHMYAIKHITIYLISMWPSLYHFVDYVGIFNKKLAHGLDHVIKISKFKWVK